MKVSGANEGSFQWCLLLWDPPCVCKWLEWLGHGVAGQLGPKTLFLVVGYRILAYCAWGGGLPSNLWDGVGRGSGSGSGEV
jgi:hypothetical protein